MRIAIYARYSSDLQTDASIEDQIRLCQELASKEKWAVVNRYTDHGISGASLMRPGIQALMQDASGGKFDLVVAEALDRLSRDQADIATIKKRLQFAGINIHTLAEGEITELHIGLKGTMNALFLKDLALKTRRGISGRIEKGKSGGGLPYGYDAVVQFDSQGERIRGDRTINDGEAAIVRRIFEEFAAGKSPKAIAVQLNREGIPSPGSKSKSAKGRGGWGQSTINGNRRRGTGILNNDLYIGVLVWNRQRFIKDPETGKRVPRFNPESQWIRKEVPELRIIDQELWDKTKARQKVLDAKGEFHKKQRPKKLFSNLLKCGCCGGGFSKVSQNHYGCSTARNKGTCTNMRVIRQDELEQAVLNALQNHLMDPQTLDIFCDEYRRYTNELRMGRNAAIRVRQEEFQNCLRERERLVQSIKDGVPAALIKDDLIRVAARQEEIQKFLENTEEAPVLIHPRMADRYKQEVGALRLALNDESHRAEAAELLRSLVEKIVLTPKEGEKKLAIDLYGDLAGILSIATNRASTTVQSGAALQAQARLVAQAQSQFNQLNLHVQDKLVAGARSELGLLMEQNQQDKLVAGVGFEPTTFGL